jgi:hypothetical protein
MNDSMTSSGPLLRTLPRAELKQFPDQRRPFVVVLGMHRSGTSLCSHVLSALGIDMTDDVSAPRSGLLQADNPKGHWERWEIVEFHDRILRSFNRVYESVAHDFCLPAAWWADQRVASVRREIVAYLQGRMEGAPFGFKDPRTVRLMPIWHQIFAELKLAPKIVYCLRDPVQVGRSVHARDGLSPELAQYRWLVYNIEFFRHTKMYEFCTVEYEAWFEEPVKNVARLRSFLDLSSYHDDLDIEFLASGIVDRALRHDDLLVGNPHHPLIRSVYNLARSAEQDHAARNKLQNIAAEFLGFQQLHCAFERELEHNATLAARVPDIEQEAIMLRAALNERDTRLALLDANNATLRGAVEAAEKDTDEMRQALEAIRLEVAAREKRSSELETELAEAERKAEERNEETASLRQEITELRDVLGNTERAARAAEFRAAEAKRVAEVAERRATERGSLAANAAELQNRLAANAAELQNRLAANAAELQNRIDALATELTGARRVARAALQALAGSETNIVDREPPQAGDMCRPRWIQVDALRRMVTAARTSWALSRSGK